MSNRKRVIPGLRPAFKFTKKDLADPIKLGIVLRVLREAHGLSQSQLAEGICQRQTISDLELGKIKHPPLNLILILCWKLQVKLVMHTPFETRNDVMQRKFEQLLYEETPECLMAQLTTWREQGTLTAYIYALGNAYYFAATGKIDVAAGFLDEYLKTQHFITTDLEEIRLQLNRINLAILKAVQNPKRRVKIAEYGKKLVHITQQFMARPNYFEVDDQARVGLILVNTLMLFNYTEAVGVVINKTDILTKRSSLAAFHAEFHLNHAGYLTRQLKFADALVALDKAEAVFKAFEITNKKNEMDFLRAVVTRLKEMHEDVREYSVADCHVVVNELRQKYKISNH